MFIVEIIKTILYFTLLLVCAYTDYKEGKIYNKNLMRFILAFVVLHITQYVALLIVDKNSIGAMLIKLKDSGLGFVVAFAIGFIFYAIGIFKGGDGKLIAIVGLCSGLSRVFKNIAMIFIVAGIGSLYVLIKNRILLKRLKRIYLYFSNIFLKRSLERYETDNDNIVFPFAVFILIAEIISYVLYYKGWAWI